MNRLLTAKDVGDLLRLSPASIAALRRTRGLTPTGPRLPHGGPNARYFTPLNILEFLTAAGNERYAQTVVDALVPRPDVAEVLAAFFGFEDPRELEQDAESDLQYLRDRARYGDEDDEQPSAWRNFHVVPTTP